MAEAPGLAGSSVMANSSRETGGQSAAQIAVNRPERIRHSRIDPGDEAALHTSSGLLYCVTRSKFRILARPIMDVFTADYNCGHRRRGSCSNPPGEFTLNKRKWRKLNAPKQAHARKNIASPSAAPA